MKILVYGAGPLGSLFSARLLEAGHDVSLLARGQRLADLREHGVVLADTQIHIETVARPKLVEALAPDDAYDLVLVIMRKNRALEILPALAANQHTPNILFLMNNAAGPDQLVAALGAERVMWGFPMAAGYRRGHVIHYMVPAEEGEKAHIPFGEIDGQITARTLSAAAALSSMAGFDAEIRTDMDAWLKTHVALLMPSLAPALAGAGNDNIRLAHTRDLIVLGIRSVRESFRVLKALGIPIAPKSVRIFEWLPEPLLVWVMQRRLVDPNVRTALVEHAGAAQDEIQFLADEFRELARRSGVSTPASYQLYAYFDPGYPRMAEGRAEIPLDWRGVWAGAGILAGIVGAGILLARWLCRK